MKKLGALISRNLKETLRDPLSLIFCLAFPVFMLVLMQLIFSGMEFVPENFNIENYANGICVFGFGFVGMFVAMQIASDKNSSFIKRLNVAPLPKTTYFLSFVFAALPLSVAQSVLFFAVALCFGFPFGNLLFSVLFLIPSALFYISLGVAVGTVCRNEKQTGPVFSLFISLLGILGGIFMPVSLLSGGFAAVVNALPFSHTVLIASELNTVGFAAAGAHLPYVLGYTAGCLIFAFAVQAIESKKNG